jgi:hypothetical protein
VPAWPPAATPGQAAVVADARRTPAGAYLAPSAVLPPLDAAPVAGTRRSTGRANGAAADGSEDASPAQLSLAETLAAFGITGDAARRLIGAGGAIAAMGFVLPWAEVMIGSGLAGSYWARWGMAGPGHWIVVGLLVGLVVAALAHDRVGRLPVGRLPVGTLAIGLGALLVGLVWPYLFGVIGHAVGVWLVLVGAIALVVGGILDLRRHADASPDV